MASLASSLCLLLATMAAAVITQSALAAQYVAPGECSWTHHNPNGGDAPVAQNHPFDVSLRCSVRTLGGPSGLNLSLIQAEHTAALAFTCDPYYLYESRLMNGSLSHLRHLRELRVENCKLSLLGEGSLSGLHHQLKNLSIRSHAEAWSAVSLRIAPPSLQHLKSLELLDLGFNNMGALPHDLFCPLTSLKVLNLTHNRLHGFGSLGLVDHTTGHLCLQELEELDLSHNRITHLSENSIASLKSLRRLFLQHNAITKIAELSLSALSKLHVIDLSHNLLTTLPSRTFRDSEELRELHLQNNSLAELVPGLFGGLSKLLILRLNHNRITSEWITADTFVDLTRVVILDLGFNRLSTINESYFHTLFSVQILRLHNNELRTIGDHSFATLYNLHTLILSGNKLRSLEPHTLNGLYVLSQLRLDYNELSFIHEDAMLNASNLQGLYLQGNVLSEVPAAITPLRFLRSLNLADNAIADVRNPPYAAFLRLRALNISHNQIQNLTLGSLHKLAGLESFDASSNLIGDIERKTFEESPNLKELHLEHNALTDVNGLFSALEQLDFLNISCNEIIWFDYVLLPKYLAELDIHQNRLKELENYFKIHEEFSLRRLDASHNAIEYIARASLPDRVEFVDLSYNHIKSVAGNSFIDKGNLSRVDLTHNNLTSLGSSALRLKAVRQPVPTSASSSSTTIQKSQPTMLIASNPYYCDCSMEWLQRYNRLDTGFHIYPEILDLSAVVCELPFNRQTKLVPLVKANSSNFLCTYKSHCFALCHCCEFDACDCEMQCPENCTCYYDQTWDSNIVDCSASDYRAIPARIPMDVTELYLDGNDIRQLTSHTFIGRKNLKVLYLNNSRVEGINNRTFNGLQYLEVLHLEHNQLSALHGFEFDSLVRLRELHLHHNRLSVISNRTFLHLRSLEVLHLEHNAITRYEIWNLNHNTKLMAVYLSTNRWSCGCAYMEEFQNWLRVFQSSVPDSSAIQCHHNGSAATPGPFLWEFNSSRCDGLTTSNDHRSGGGAGRGGALDGSGEGRGYDGTTAVSFFPADFLQDYLPLLVVLLLVLLLLLFLGVVLLVYRKEFQVWFYAKYGHRLFQRAGGSAGNGSGESEKLFDAFVSYCKKDEAFIAQILAPELECGHPPYRLCLRYRDLPVTGYVAEAITEAIESSHRTVLLLSEHFLQSEACLFELKVATHQVSVNPRAHKLLVVLLDKTCLTEASAEVKLCLRQSSSTAIIHWGDRRFWEKLRYAMPSGRGHSGSGHHLQKPMNCPDVRASLEFKRAMNTMNAV